MAANRGRPNTTGGRPGANKKPAARPRTPTKANKVETIREMPQFGEFQSNVSRGKFMSAKEKPAPKGKAPNTYLNWKDPLKFDA